MAEASVCARARRRSTRAVRMDPLCHHVPGESCVLKAAQKHQETFENICSSVRERSAELLPHMVPLLEFNVLLVRWLQRIWLEPAVDGDLTKGVRFCFSHQFDPPEKKSSLLQLSGGQRTLISLILFISVPPPLRKTSLSQSCCVGCICGWLRQDALLR